MTGACSSLVGAGVIRGVLGAVDCQTRAFAEAGYSALTASSSSFQVALTILLTLYIALVGYRMLFATGGVRLSEAPGIALRIGAVLALVTSWATFQTLVFDMAARTPKEIAGVIAAPLQDSGASSLAADPVGGLQIAYDQLTQAAAAFGKAAGPVAHAYASPAAAAAEALSTASGVLFMASAGVAAAATLAIGVLTAVGPIFIALLLIPATRGLFVGWVRALVGAALVTLLGWLVIVVMLSVLEPWLASLAEQRRIQALDPQTALSTAALVFVFGAGQAALMIGALVTAAGFRIGGPMPSPARTPRADAAPPAVAPESASRAQRLAFDLQRDQTQAAGRLMLARAAAAGTRAAPPAAAPASNGDRSGRLGDAYRRPSVQRPAGSRA